MILDNNKIPGVFIKELIIHSDNRGRLFEILREDDPFFIRFGQVFSNLTKPGMVRNFHKHLKRTTTFCCIQGEIKVALVDEENMSLNEYLFSGDVPTTIVIPPKIFYGWKTVSDINALTISISTELFDPKNPDTFYFNSSNSSWHYDW